MLELLMLSILHDRLRLLVLLDREALFVPIDRFGFFGERSDHAGEGADFL